MSLAQPITEERLPMPRWTLRLLLSLGCVLVVVALGLAYVMSRDSATPVDVADAVDRYRDEGSGAAGSSTTTTPAGPSLPAAGVYVYTTEGAEHLDVLGGATHGYPVRTTLTITATDCGLRQRWTPIEERWDEEELCLTDSGLERQTLHTHHEFFTMADDQDFVCQDGYIVLPADPAVGDTWTTDCQADSVHITGTGRVVGFEEREVAGTPIETVHVRIDETATGSSTGPSSDDYWLRTTDGLLIERATVVQSRSDSPVGKVQYEERFSLRLTSLTPST
jgi:hypothetical protein